MPIIYRVADGPNTDTEFTAVGTILTHLDGASASAAPAGVEVWPISGAVYANLKPNIIG